MIVHMKKMRILQIITKADWAGAQRVVFEICKGVKDNYYNLLEIEVAVGDNGLLAKKLRDIGIKVHVLNNLVHKISPIIDLKGYFELKKLIKDNEYDVVHCHSTKAGILGRLAANKIGVKKIIYTVHGWWPIFMHTGVKRNLAIMVERYLATKCTDLVLLSNSDKKLTREMGIGEDRQYRLIYNSITLPKIKKGALRKELGLNESIKIIGNVSRVDEQKNPFLFIDIANEYFKQLPNEETIFVWVGDGMLLPKVKAKIEKLGLINRVKFVGFREDGAKYLADFDLLLMTSNWEGVPITVLEASELNIPILSTDVGGIKEVIGENCVFSPSEDYTEIVKRIILEDCKPKVTNKNMVREYMALYY